MPFYIRKSVSAGPFRFNFSKGGVGVSVGIKGLRIGTGPRGHYIHAGRGGLYYRATLGNAGRSRSSGVAPYKPSPDVTFDNSDVTMTEIESGDVMYMQDESFSELLNEINSKAGQTRMSAALMWTAAGIGAFAGLASGGPGLLLCALALPGWAIGKWLDSYRRTTVLYYDLEGDAESAYNHLVQGFDGLNGCAAKWHIEAGGAVQNLTAWKRNAGASHLVNRKATTLAYSLPSVIKSNVTPPALHVGKQIMFFMPDIVLVQDGGRVGAVNYVNLNIKWQDSRFVETERVPSDAKIVDYTWKHPNKSGGPDRRFKDNRQIPVCLYEAIHFTSNSGVNELVEFSRIGVADSFANGCRKLATLPRERTIERPSAPANDVVEAAPIVEPVRKRNRLRTAAFTILGLTLGLPALALVIGSGKQKSDTGLQPNLVLETSGTLSADTAASSAQGANPPLLQSTDARATPVSTSPIATSHDLTRSESIVGGEEERTVRYTKTMVNLREGPGTKFAVVAVIQKDTVVSVLEVKGGWSRVRVDEKKNGWMANSTISDRP
ncbi:DUF4236 domain-containing protein [Agrobacterium tumefaciens]|uniref:SH3b domain-containing protein n=1 Tax=Agrobacterium tumefaciens TaxID=358 RepID=A0A2L2LCB2_AGRTU|nr:DUF4236 domain-containing protein [Agrobacterium tumefaciens]AVH41896.1 hypothetical protein At1D1609_18420 [Agrobacterium tumefaciens]NSY95811.1 DUF4236 domain-containing protein [Agrobacterium tumefaciens]